MTKVNRAYTSGRFTLGVCSPASGSAGILHMYRLKSSEPERIYCWDKKTIYILIIHLYPYTHLYRDFLKINKTNGDVFIRYHIANTLLKINQIQKKPKIVWSNLYEVPRMDKFRNRKKNCNTQGLGGRRNGKLLFNGY